MKTSLLVAAGALILVEFTSACANSNRTVYTASQTGQIMTEDRGEVVSVRDVVIESGSPIGLLSASPGRKIGSAIGRSVATGSTMPAKIAVGETVGGELGAHLDDKAGEEISIRIAGSDRIVIVVQERSSPPLAAGERVRVLTGSSSGGGMGGLSALIGGASGGNVRVIRADYLAGEARELAGAPGSAAGLPAGQAAAR